MSAPARWRGGPPAHLPLIAVTTSEMRHAALGTATAGRNAVMPMNIGASRTLPVSTRSV